MAMNRYSFFENFKMDSQLVQERSFVIEYNGKLFKYGEKIWMIASGEPKVTIDLTKDASEESYQPTRRPSSSETDCTMIDLMHEPSSSGMDCTIIDLTNACTPPTSPNRQPTSPCCSLGSPNYSPASPYCLPASPIYTSIPSPPPPPFISSTPPGECYNV